MREADVAIRLRQPTQPDLIQRKLFTVHMHLYASEASIARHGGLSSIEDLDNHRIVTFGEPIPTAIADVNWLETAGRPDGSRRTAHLQINDLLAIRRAVQRGAGIAALPDYMVQKDAGLIQLLPESQVPSFDTYFAYTDAMKSQVKLQVFRDFLIAKARNWSF